MIEQVAMNIKHGECGIRSATHDDAAMLCRWWNDGEVMEHAGFPDGLGTDVHAVARIIERNGADRHLMVIEIDEIPIGELHYRSRDHEPAEIGIKIFRPQYRGRGYGPRVLELLISYLFEERAYKRIVLDTNVRNERAQRMYEKLGFRETGRRIDSWTDQRGELQSVIDYELVRSPSRNTADRTVRPE